MNETFKERWGLPFMRLEWRSAFTGNCPQWVKGSAFGCRPLILSISAIMHCVHHASLILGDNSFQDLECHWRHLSRDLLFVHNTGSSGGCAVPHGRDPDSKGNLSHTSFSASKGVKQVRKGFGFVVKSETGQPLSGPGLDVKYISRWSDSGAALAIISEMPGQAHRKMRSGEC